MIEVVPIDNETGQADLLRLATSLFEQRLLTKKQIKQLQMVVEVTAYQPPRAIPRLQLAQKPGLFKGSKYRFDCAVNVAQGFEAALAQLTHELVHVSQILNNRYQITQKTKKVEGQKQKLFFAKWLGKNCGVIDELLWEARPWESEAVLISNQLISEFFALTSGQQSHFPAQGKKKELRLYEMALSLPPMPAPPVSPPPISAPPISASPMPVPAEQAPLEQAPNQQIPDPLDMSPASEGAPLDMDVDQIDALLAAPEVADVPAFGAEGAAAFGGVPDFAGLPPHPNEAEIMAPGTTANGDGAEAVKLVYVQGIDEPRSLSHQAVMDKKRELAERGLL